jgi:hypothetical protein
VSGHVFHPGHDDLHGITVVLETATGKTVIGRWHERVEKGVVLHDAALHEAGSQQTRDEFIARSIKFGVKPEHRTLVVSDEIASVRKLAEF